MGYKKLLIAKVYVDDIKNISVMEFYKKFVVSIKRSLLEEYGHLLSEDKCNRISNILTIKFITNIKVNKLIEEYNNINFMVSIVDEYEYDYFNLQDEEHFLKLNNGKTTHRNTFVIPLDKSAEVYLNEKNIMGTKV